MKILSLVFSLLLGAAVLLFFLQPWDRLEKMLGDTGGREAAPAKPSGAGEETAAVETAPPKLPDTASPPATPAVAPNARADPKTHMLANEKAEAERSAALQRKVATPGPRETKRYFKVKVLDAGTLEAGSPTEVVVIRLEGIDTHEADETCKTKSGKTWPCGAKARAALTLFIRSRAVTCSVPPGAVANDFAARCSVMDQDLSTWLVRRGWATPQGNSEAELAKALDAAKTEKLGLWQAE
jgi:endonuclease YncB( thermonuclease family)